MPENASGPGKIMGLATGYWNSATLLTANELGVFAVLGSGKMTAAEVSGELNTDLRATEQLLDACAGLDLLRKQSGEEAPVYENSADSAAFLVPGAPGYLGTAISWSYDQFSAWGDLVKTLRSGLPAVPPSRHLGDDPDETRRFVHGMHGRAIGVARTVVGFLDMTGIERLLDVGGGPGTYATLLAERNPTLRVTVLDLPAVANIATELISLSSAADRVEAVGGDATGGDYGADAYDAVLFSGVLHQMSADVILRMFRGAFKALKPGGRVLVSDLMLDSTKTRPLFSTLFSLEMLLVSDKGAVFSVEECQQWLESAGFTDSDSQALPPPLPYVVVSARKPQG